MKIVRSGSIREHLSEFQDCLTNGGYTTSLRLCLEDQDTRNDFLTLVPIHDERELACKIIMF